MTDARKNKKSEQGERIQKKLATLGFGSRREIERLISEGQVKVNGCLARIGERLQGNEQIQVKGRKISLKKIKTESSVRVIALHKPIGVICTRRDEQKRPTVFSYLPSIRNARWVMIGRLDINTQGLLLFTNDGGLANKLMHPSSEVEREYLVRVFGVVDDGKLSQLQKGIELEDGFAKFESVHVVKSEEKDGHNQFFKVVLKEGRNREVRRLWEAVDCQVSRLKRVRYANYEIPISLRQGHVCELSPCEVKKLIDLV